MQHYINVKNVQHLWKRLLIAINWKLSKVSKSDIFACMNSFELGDPCSDGKCYIERERFLRTYSKNI